MRITKRTAAILLLMMGVMLTACTTVQPWERGNLAKPQMALDPYPLQSALRAHNYGSREAAAGGNAAQGGGCGCY
jgi:starvation-inducible outer membrane lipoprotein